MSKKWIIFFVILGILALVGVIWYRRKRNNSVSLTSKINDQESDQKAEEEESGETIPSLHSQNYKGVANDIFYLSYVAEGKSEIEEVSKEKYDQFIKDYPSGIAKGNVIKKYL